jgi:hypothetical protein
MANKFEKDFWRGVRFCLSLSKTKNLILLSLWKFDFGIRESISVLLNQKY